MSSVERASLNRYVVRPQRIVALIRSVAMITGHGGSAGAREFSTLILPAPLAAVGQKNKKIIESSMSKGLQLKIAGLYALRNKRYFLAL